MKEWYMYYGVKGLTGAVQAFIFGVGSPLLPSLPYFAESIYMEHECQYISLMRDVSLVHWAS